MSEDSQETKPEDPSVESDSTVTSNGSVVRDEDDLVQADYGDGSPPELLWIKEDNNDLVVTIYAYKDPESGKLKAFSLEISYGFRELKFIEFPIESRWSVPDRDQLTRYRDRASRLDPRVNRVMLDRAVLQLMVVKHHLKELKLGKSEILTLPRDKNGSLSEKAFTILGKLHPTVMDMVFLKFTDEAALVI